MSLEWSDRYKIGEEKTDEEHLEWFRLANTFLAAVDLKSKQETGEAFRRYTCQHFFNEEAMMHEMQFPYIATHVEEHERLVYTLNQILDVAGDDVLTKTELDEFVGYCLTRHIIKFDAPLEIYLKQNGLMRDSMQHHIAA